MPEGINHLRIGENILLGKDLQVDWGIRDMDYLRTDGFTLRAEVVEVRDKPTYPIGEFAIDAFGRKPVYEDRGIRRRAILALGRADEAIWNHCCPVSRASPSSAALPTTASWMWRTAPGGWRWATWWNSPCATATCSTPTAAVI